MAAPAAWDENDRLRTEASAAIVRAAQAAGAGRLVQESLAFVYADGWDRWLDETAAAAGGGTTTTALVAEADARELFAEDSVVLRFGLFIGPESRLTPLISRRDVYAADRPGLLSPRVRHDLARVYVPNSKSDTVDVISQRTFKVVDHFAVGGLPQHVSRHGTCARCG